MRVICIILGIVAALSMLVSCSDTGGEFAHKMSDDAWAEFKASDTPHSIIEQVGKSAESGHDSIGGKTIDAVGKHDWGYGLGLIGPGIGAIGENLEGNLTDIGAMIDEFFENIDIS